MNIALLDLGSNSARMHIVSVEETGRVTYLERKRVMTRLSENMDKDGHLQEKPMERTIQTLKEFAALAKEYDAQTVAVATAAVRRAKNGQAFVAKVKEETGLPLTVIDGRKEAELGFLGVTSGLSVTDCLICDTGGGSTELTLVKQGKVTHSISLPFGAMVLYNRFGTEEGAMKTEVRRALSQVAFLREAKGLPLIGIGGSVCALWGMAKRPEPLHGSTFTQEQAGELYHRLLPLSREERLALGVEEGRADTICQGLLPTLLLMEDFSVADLTLCTTGLREGMLYHYLKYGTFL